MPHSDNNKGSFKKASVHRARITWEETGTRSGRWESRRPCSNWPSKRRKPRSQTLNLQQESWEATRSASQDLQNLEFLTSMRLEVRWKWEKLGTKSRKLVKFSRTLWHVVGKVGIASPKLSGVTSLPPSLPPPVEGTGLLCSALKMEAGVGSTQMFAAGTPAPTPVSPQHASPISFRQENGREFSGKYDQAKMKDRKAETLVVPQRQVTAIAQSHTCRLRTSNRLVSKSTLNYKPAMLHWAS